MNLKELKETCEAKSTELVQLKEQIENGDTEAIEKGAVLGDEIEKLTAEIKEAEESATKAAAALKSLGKKEIKEEEMEEKMIDEKRMSGLKDERGVYAFGMKAASDTVKGPTVTVTDQNIPVANPALRVRSLFVEEAVDGNSVSYTVMGATEGTSGVVAEGAKKNQIHPVYTSKTAGLEKIACFYNETDELLSDAPRLESNLRSTGTYTHDLAVETAIVGKIAGTSGIQTIKTGLTFDTLIEAATKITTLTGFEADAIVLNPADYLTFKQAKDSNGQYILGGPAYGAYGNGAAGSRPYIWTLPVITSNAVTAGTAYVGAFAQGAKLYTKRNEGKRVEVSNSNNDDFEKNMITIRIEERLLAVLKVPGAFVKVSNS